MNTKELNITLKHIDHALKSLNRCELSNQEKKEVRSALINAYEILIRIEAEAGQS